MPLDHTVPLDAPHLAPLVVAEGEDAYRAAVEEFIGAGWRLQSGDHAAAPDVVTLCRVTDRAEAGWAVLAALRGSPLLAHATGDRAVVDELVEDLGRIAPVVLIDDRNTVALDAETWRVLHELARGATMAATATGLHLSLRTANRRMAEARSVLDVSGRARLIRALAAPDRIPPAPGRPPAPG